MNTHRTSAVAAGLVAILALTGVLSAADTPTSTVAEARAFIEEAEARLEKMGSRAAHAFWIQANFINYSSQKLAAAAATDLTLAIAELAAEAKRFDGLDLPADLARKFLLLKLGVSAPAPPTVEETEEMSEIGVWMNSAYGAGKYCPDGPNSPQAECKTLNDLEAIMTSSRDHAELLDAWRGWRTISPQMREKYTRFVELSNKGAAELGFADTGVLWRSGYDMEPDAFAAELDRLWDQLRPLYDALHTHVRAKLIEQYGADVVGDDGMIPAHLLGNMWSQSWGNVYDMAAPPSGDPGFDLTEILNEKKFDAIKMVKTAERFFTSLGFEPLPDTFWERSLFTKPRDREVVCHASAWDVENSNDLRIKMCIKIDDEDFSTVHHELGHNFYQRAYGGQPLFFRGSANDGFHEALGDTIALSVTPAYLKQIGLLDKVPGAGGDLGLLMKMALDKVAFFPFALVVDQWRWQVFAGEITPGNYNAGWWKLREKYQRVKAPVARSEADFDPGAKYHVAGNVPYTRYFLAHVLQFQIFRALCKESGYEGPLHRCSFYGNKKVGAKLKKMMEMGQSRPWPDALEAVTGQREMDATAVLDYFAPLKKWLDEQNRNRPSP